MKMKHVLLAIAVVSMPALVMAAGGMRDGMWEITSKMEMPGMPMEMPATVVKHCYTKEEVKDQKKAIASDKDCTVSNLETSGDKATWQMKCTGQHAGTFSGETVFSGDSYDSTMKMNSDGKGRSMTMKIKAKRIGNCQ